MSGCSTNQFRIAGRVLEIEPLRYTPAGVPAVSFKLGHESRQLEAGIERTVECELDAVALGQPAQWLAGASPDVRFEVSGFMAARSQRSRRPVLHVQVIEFFKEDENGR